MPTATRDDLRRYRDNLQGEIDGVAVYLAMADGEKDPLLKELYRRLADTERRHGAVWEQRLRDAGVDTSGMGPSWRARVLGTVARRFGSGVVAPTVAEQEGRSQGMYDTQPEAAGTSLPQDERSHARLFRELAGGTGLAGGQLARIEGRHRSTGGNALRAAVLGASDGVLSNTSLIMGVAGAAVSTGAVVVAGLAGLLAGAFSMGLGEWLSVQSARELYSHQIRVEQEELEAIPEEEEVELALIYQSKGVPEPQARTLARQIVEGDPRVALDTLSREELGIDPDELGGSAYEAAFTSFLLFASGAFVPLLPFLVSSGAPA
ncbi:MAG: VIT1/CCC1 transporter family protein, partial [Chloroflexi bacterium]|nr:VIT1/CCC1 transporter family protein [Chloroflexota bacterium]